DPLELASYNATHDLMEMVPRLKSITPKDCDLIVRTALRSTNRFGKSQMSYAFREKCDNPSKSQVDAFISAIDMKTYSRDYVRAVGEVDMPDAMKEYAIAGLQRTRERLVKAGCVPTPSEGSVVEEIDDVVKRLSYRRK
ncbi:MAG: hypothetical protein H7Z43_00370, partial [Clostridia bacterium]|nr:hypothetical protein [Deltaproteobacteria bacterium]